MKNVLIIFGQLTDEDVDWLTEQGDAREVSDGDVLIREGEPIDHIHILLEGGCVVSRESGTEFARIGPGEMMGEMSFVDASPPSASVVADVDSLVFEIPRPVLARRLEADSGFAARFYRAVAMMLSERLREARGASSEGPKEGVLGPGELDPNVLEHVSRAGERFDRMLKDAKGAR